MDFTILMLSCLSLINTAVASKYYLEYQLSARTLPPSDGTASNPPDAYCYVQFRDLTGSNPANWVHDASTSTISSFNPDWPKKFTVDHVTEQQNLIKIEVYDSDPLRSEFVGDVTLAVSELVQINHGKIYTGPTDMTRQIEHKPPHNGKLIISSRITKIEGSRRAASASRNHISLPYAIFSVILPLRYFLRY